MGLINHCAPLSTSEVGLNFGPDAGITGSFGPGWCYKPGLKGGALVPVGATNRDQRSPLPALWAAEKRPLVPVGGTNRD